MNQIYYCTTFSQPLYDLTGKHLLRSFLDTNSVGKFIIGLEMVEKDKLLNNNKFILLDRIHKDSYYLDWLNSFKDYIPPCYGGNKEDWSKEEQIDAKQASYNKQTARWFKKVAILRRAAEIIDNTDYLIFLDSDCRFLKRLENFRIQKFVGDHEWMFTFGPWRKAQNKGHESGLMIFRGHGLNIIYSCYDRYLSGRFLNEYRWDDGYIWYTLQRDFGQNYKYKDLVNPRSQHGHVLQDSVFAKYLAHDKGKHHKSNILPHQK